MRPGYEPWTPQTNTAPSFYSLESEQKRVDEVYKHGSGNSLDHYYAMYDAWIETNTRLRAVSADPLHYVPTALPPIPKREIVDWDPVAYCQISRFEQDPAIVAPSLPPYIAPVTVEQSGIRTTLPAQQAEDAAKYALLVRMLSDLNVKVTAIGVKVGV